MFVRAHHVPDPTSSSPLAKFPLLGLSRASEHLHIFPRLFTALFFPALFFQFHPFNVSKRQSTSVYIPMFAIYQPFRSNRITLHLRCCLQQHAFELPLCFTIDMSSLKFFVFPALQQPQPTLQRFVILRAERKIKTACLFCPVFLQSGARKRKVFEWPPADLLIEP